MSTKNKCLLIVDDSDIDRNILKNILANDFTIIEAENGFRALEILKESASEIDGMLLDISMPILDGFNVLRLLNKEGIRDFPIVMISAEALKENIQQAALFGVHTFIKKPFDSAIILNRIRSLFESGTVPVGNETIKADFTPETLESTNALISKLQRLYRSYLIQNNMSDANYLHVVEIMKILLEEYAAETKNTELSPTHIRIIAKAAYFYNIGKMIVPLEDMTQLQTEVRQRPVINSHTTAGAELIKLNNDPNTAYFTSICADMCQHHHERYDGTGIPHGLKGTANSIYTQMCSLVSVFVKSFFEKDEQNERQFNLVANKLAVENGAVHPDLIQMLKNCRGAIIDFYKEQSDSSFRATNLF